MTDMYFDFGDVRVTVPEHYLSEIIDFAWFWGHTELAEKIELTDGNVIDINHEEFIQLTQILYALVR